MKVGILLPNNRPTFDKKFIMSLLGVVCSFYVWDKDHKHQLNILVQNEGEIAFMRNRLATDALAKGVDYMLWLDCDMAIPPTVIQRMVSYFEKYENIEAVTGLYTWKEPPFLPHVYSTYNEQSKKFKMGATFPLDKPFDVDGAGFGCLMIKSEVFKRTPQPWFEMKLGKTCIEYGEDLYFCRKARPKMICDPTISCGHFTENMVDINSYLQYNGLKVEKNAITATSQQIQSAAKEHKDRNIKRAEAKS